LLFGVCCAVTVFRGAYEQMGNTVALWADVGIDRTTSLFTVPMTWFQALNPLLVILMTPFLLARWRRRAAAGKEHSSMQKMAVGALVVAGAFLLLAAVATLAGSGRANALWLVLFFVIFTLGELYVLPTGLGLFARLAPDEVRATTVAAWFLTIFSGSLSAGLVGMLWSAMTHAHFFLMLSVIAAASGAICFSLDGAARRIETSRAASVPDSSTLQPEIS
jgi:proton-dependent oligopeptide transporter, POT family